MLRHSFALRWFAVGKLASALQLQHLSEEETRDFRAQFGDTWHLVQTMLGHRSVETTKNVCRYIGDYDSGFPDEYAFEDALARMDELTAGRQALSSGEHVSGPAATSYRERVTGTGGQFGGRVLTSSRQARDLLANPLLKIFHGDGMTCVFDPQQAACQLRGTADDPTVTPDIDDCRPRCPNIARTDRDITVVRAKHDQLALIVADPLAPPIRHQRDRTELERLESVLRAHDATRDGL